MPKPYTLKNLSNIKKGSFVFPYLLHNRWTAGDGWGCDNKALEKSKFFAWQFYLLPPICIPNAALQGSDGVLYTQESEKTKTYFFRNEDFTKLKLKHRQPLKIKFGGPIGMYLGDIISIIDTHQVAVRILSLNGEIIWF